MIELSVALVLIAYGATAGSDTHADSMQEEVLTGEDAARMVRSIVAKQARCMGKLPRYEAVVVQEIKGRVIEDYTYALYNLRLIRDGDRRHVINSASLKGTTHTTDSVQHLIVTERFVASFTDGTGSAHMWEHDSIHDISRRAQSEIKIRTCNFDFLFCGFGAGTRSLADIAQDAVHFKLRVLRDDGLASPIRFIVDAYYTPGAAIAAYTLTIDASHGYLVTKVEHRDSTSDGFLMEQMTVEGKEYFPGIWWPSRCERLEFDLDEMGRTVLYRAITMRIVELKREETIDPDNFELKAMGFPQSTYIMRSDSSGRKSQMVLRQGELIPWKLANGENVN